MRKWSKWVSVSFILLVIVMLTVSACSNETQSNTDGTSVEESNSEQDAEEKSTLTVTIYDRGNIPADEGTYEDNRWTDWINENFTYANVEFVAIPRWSPAEKLNVLFASGSAPDLIFEFSASIRDSLYQSKQMMPIKDLIDEHSVEYKALLEEYPETLSATARDDGQMYEFPRMMVPRKGAHIFYRADWFETLGLEVPTTTEELFEVAEAIAKQDPDENGQEDTYGINIGGIADGVINNMFGTHGLEDNFRLMDGKAVYQWDRVKAATEFKSRLYKGKIINQDYLSTEAFGSQDLQDFVNGKLGILIVLSNESYTTRMLEEIVEPLLTNDSNAVVKEMMLPEGPFGNFTDSLNIPIQTPFFINANAEDPVAAVKYMDFLLQESTATALRYGLEDVHYVLDENGCPSYPDDPELAEEMKKKREKELVYVSDYILPYTPLFDRSECRDETRDLDPENNPAHQQVIAAYHQHYYSILPAVVDTKEYPLVTSSALMPAVPKELLTYFTNNATEVANVLTKSILDSDEYSVDQAIEDAKIAWENGKGDEILDYYAEYFNSNDDLVLGEDIVRLLGVEAENRQQ